MTAQLVQDNRTSWNRKSLVFVHGIGKTPETYADPLYEILRARNPAAADAARWYAVAYDFVNEVMAQKLRLVEEQIPGPDKPASPAKEAFRDLFLDLLTYLGTNNLYHWINTVFKGSLAEVVARGQRDGVHQDRHEIYLIAHSLGTVVAYEGVHAIIGDPQVVGLSSNFRVQALLTMGSPLAFIKKYQDLIPSLSRSRLREHPIGKPEVEDSFTGEKGTNVLAWYNFRHKLDPVASLVPLDQNTANRALTEDTFVFDAYHAGPNAHAFSNHLVEFAGFLWEKISG
jgi:hypothetical protein